MCYNKDRNTPAIMELLQSSYPLWAKSEADYKYPLARVKELDRMKFTISGKNIDVTEGLKAAVRDKLGKLERYFTPDTEVIVTMSVEKERQKIEVTIPVTGNIIRSEQVSNDMYA